MQSPYYLPEVWPHRDLVKDRGTATIGKGQLCLPWSRWASSQKTIRHTTPTTNQTGLAALTKLAALPRAGPEKAGAVAALSVAGRIMQTFLCG